MRSKVRRVASSSVVVVLGVVWVASAAACGGSDGGDAAEPRPPVTEFEATSAPSSSTTTTTLDPIAAREAAILAAVDGYWLTAEQASQEPVNPDHRGFAQYYVGDALRTTTLALAEDREQGEALRFPSGAYGRPETLVVTSDNSSAVVHDCVIDDAIRYRVDTGEVINDDVITYVYELGLVRDNSGWKVASNGLLAERVGTECPVV